MKKILLLTALVVTSLLLTQCKEKKDSTSTMDNPENQQDGIENVQVIEGYMFDTTDPFEITSVNLDGDILSISVSYSGGCQEHQFDLIFNGSYKKSLPPQIDLYLTHNSNNDNCRAMIAEELKFNIADVKGGNKKVIISLNNYKDKIEYE